jgi:ABC-2 type transport system ATP-binding protein
METGVSSSEPEASGREIVLSADGLTKRFGRRAAVSDVSFDVHAGEVFGFLGPNGAGKTTTIRMLVGLARPDAGRVRIRGLDLASDFERAMAHVGSIVEAPDLYRYLTGRENLLHFSRMLPPGAADRIPELAALVALSERLDDRVSTYSLGMRQRLGIAQALLGNPDVLILDEPANGLDPAGIREIRQLVRRLASERGIAVFVSSHLLSEIEQMCDRVAIIHRGRTLAAAPVEELLERVASDVVRVRARPAARAAEVLTRFGPTEAEAEADGGGGIVAARVPPEQVPEALRALVAAGVDVFAVERPMPSLEEIFLEITGGETV